MSLINTWVFTKTSIDADKLLQATRNEFRVVTSRAYSDKKGKMPDGITLTVTVLHDDHDYGVDKNGNQRDSNQFQTFDVTVLNRKHNVKKGDVIKLLDFDAENSFAIGFDLLLRFKDLEIIPKQGMAQPQAMTAKPQMAKRDA